jgi:hypothetical protein
MAIMAIATDWDKELTDKAFVAMKIKQAQVNRKLERYDRIPKSGNGLSVFIENIEKFSKKDIQSRFFYTSRPRDNHIFYTCKNLISVPDPLMRVTDFFFAPNIMKNGNLRIHIFRHGDWMDMDKDNLIKSYMKTHIFNFSKMKDWKKHLKEENHGIEKGRGHQGNRSLRDRRSPCQDFNGASRASGRQTTLGDRCIALNKFNS